MRRAVSYTFLGFLISLLSIEVSSQEIKVSVRSMPDTSVITIGDHIAFQVIVEQPSGIRLEIMQLSDTLTRGIEILRGPVRDTIFDDSERIILKERYIVTSFDSGRYEIPPFYAELQSGDGIRRFYSDYSYLEVKRASIDPPETESGFFDIIAPYRVPVTAGEIMSWSIAAIILLVAAWFAYRYFINKRLKAAEDEVEALSEAAHVIAYRNLERLKNEKLWQQERYKDYYTRLTEIVRDYIDNRFGLNSMESTTEETLSLIRNLHFVTEEAFDSLTQMLSLADMVKFAKYLPESSDCELSMEQAWSFVSLTRKERRKLVDDKSDADSLIQENQ